MISNDRYHGFSRFLHWLMAIALLAMIAVGSYMSDLADDAPGRLELINLHKASGFALLWLALLRLGWSFIKTSPPLPSAFNRTETRLMKATKHLLYLAMILVPLSGWMMANFAGYAVKYGGVSVPLLFTKNKQLAGFFHETHEILPWVLLALIIAHLTAVIYHRFEGGDKDILKRML